MSRAAARRSDGAPSTSAARATHDVTLVFPAVGAPRRWYLGAAPLTIDLLGAAMAAVWAGVARQRQDYVYSSGHQSLRALLCGGAEASSEAYTDCGSEASSAASTSAGEA
jgi:hypothetical protein